MHKNLATKLFVKNRGINVMYIRSCGTNKYYFIIFILPAFLSKRKNIVGKSAYAKEVILKHNMLRLPIVGGLVW